MSLNFINISYPKDDTFMETDTLNSESHSHIGNHTINFIKYLHKFIKFHEKKLYFL